MATVMQNGNRPISAVLHDIVGNFQHIVRSEVRMAKTELREELGKSASAGMLLGVGVLLLVFSVLFVLLAAVHALSLVVPSWMAALIVGAGIGLIAAACVGLGISRFKRVRAPPKTVETVKEDVEWAKQLTR
jgi:uncharacterized membrane protein YqjE